MRAHHKSPGGRVAAGRFLCYFVKEAHYGANRGPLFPSAVRGLPKTLPLATGWPCRFCRLELFVERIPHRCRVFLLAGLLVRHRAAHETKNPWRRVVCWPRFGLVGRAHPTPSGPCGGHFGSAPPHPGASRRRRNAKQGERERRMQKETEQEAPSATGPNLFSLKFRVVIIVLFPFFFFCVRRIVEVGVDLTCNPVPPPWN